MTNPLMKHVSDVLNVEQYANWLLEAKQKLSDAQFDINQLLLLSAESPRVIDRQRLLAGQFQGQNIRLLDYVRGQLLSDVLKQSDNKERVFKDYYRFGDSSEKISLLKCLPFFDDAKDALSTALRASRTNQLDEFSAIALNNTFPQRFFPQLNFNQLILKSLFLNLDITQVRGLLDRQNIELSNMCFSYAIEQLNAKRDLPFSVWFAVRYADLLESHKAKFDQVYLYYCAKSDEHKRGLDSLKN